MSDTLNINKLNDSNYYPTLSRKMSTATLLSLESECDGSPSNPEEEREELKCAQEVINALKLYRIYSYDHLNKAENYLNCLPKRQRSMLSKYRQHLSILRDCIDKNQSVINKMLREKVPASLHENHEIHGHGTKKPHQELEKAQLILKHIARDWSSACAAEREQSYKPIIEAIQEFFKAEECDPSEVKILVPGAGLGRLTYELACQGYDCEGNEFSFFMLIASHFILNRCKKPNSYTLYPWVHQYMNNLHSADQMASIQFPDVCMSQQQPKGKVIMVAGDFLQVYTIPNSYDCVATCFFIDCANNIVDFMETIYKILIPGGIWVNLGPLLYQYCDIQGENSIEPTYDQLIPIIETIGFEIVRKRTGVRTKYAQNPHSMLKSEYESVFWICRKPLNATDSAGESSDDNDFDRNGLRTHNLGFGHFYN